MDGSDQGEQKLMKVSDLLFSDLFRTEITEGKVFFNQRRAILFDMEAMGALRRQLIATLGEELAMGVLMRFGYSHGFNDAAMLGSSVQWATEVDWLAAGPVMHIMEGLVHVSPRQIAFDRQTGAFHMHGVWRNSYEAEVHREQCGPSTHPVCWTLTGYASGYATRFFGRDLLAIETACVGKGDDCCYWEIRPVGTWGPEASPYLKALKAVDLSSQLRQLQTAEARFRDVVFSHADWIWETDAAGRFTYCSEHVTRVLGFSPEEVLGRRFVELVPPDEAGRWTEVYTAAASSRRPIVDLEIRHLTREGRETMLLSNGVPVLDDRGHLSSYRWIGKDVTERRREEEERRALERQVQQTQKLESLGVMAGGIAHDFNNLLMVVLGNAEMALRQVSPTSSARVSLTEIGAAARRAAELCRQMLAYAGRASLAMERVWLPELVEEMAHLLRTAISARTGLSLRLDRKVPPILGDSSQIRQIVMSLILNASEAIGDRDGTVSVTVGATRCDEDDLRRSELRDNLAPGLHVHLEVADTGCGMDAETRARIFEPFFSTKVMGRGLGLAAVLGIVRGHRGSLRVDSAPGEGTTFTILFPALENGETGGLVKEPPTPTGWRGQGTILLVDDEESLRAIGARMLEELGFAVLTAADGRAAVRVYSDLGPQIDLVLLDLTMPHMDGMEALRELRRLNPEVRAVLASGHSRESLASRFAEENLSGLLQKPYSLEKLRELLAGLLPARPGGEA